MTAVPELPEDVLNDLVGFFAAPNQAQCYGVDESAVTIIEDLQSLHLSGMESQQKIAVWQGGHGAAILLSQVSTRS